MLPGNTFRPDINRSRGSTTALNIVIADTGLPGKPIIGFPAENPKIVGLPGFTDNPCINTPGEPILFITCAVRSLELIELPAVKTTMSETSIALLPTSNNSSNSSGTLGNKVGKALRPSTSAPIVYRLISRIIPPVNFSLGGTNSSPEDITATFGVR